MNDVSCYSPAGLIEYFVDPQRVSFDCRLVLQSVSTGVSLPTLTEYVQVFLLTCLLELPFYFLVLKQKKVGLFKSLFLLLICNLATHPFIYLLLPYIGSKLQLSYAEVLTGAEIFAPLLEALLLVFVFKTNFFRSFVLMILGNLFSWWVGIYLLH